MDRILETCLYAEDLDAAERFYCQVLGLEVFATVQDGHVFFRCGDGMFLVFRADRARQEGRGAPPHGAAGPGHVAFAVRARDLDAWKERLQRHAVEIERETEWPHGGHSVYFRDPAGNSVELATPAIWRLQE